MGRKAKARIGIAALCALGAVFAAPASAGTGTTHPFLFTIDGSDSPAGSLSDIRDAIGVDQTTGDLYVVDEAHQVIDVYDSAGNYQRQISGLNCPGKIAVDNSGGSTDGNVYVTDAGGNPTNRCHGGHVLVKAFNRSGTALLQLDGSTTPQKAFVNLSGLGIDAAGNIYIGGNNPAFYEQKDLISKFSSSGEYLTQITDPALGHDVGSVVFDPAGKMYVGRSVRGVGKFTAQGAFISDIEEAGDIAFDPVTGDAYKSARGYVVQVDPSDALVSRCCSLHGDTEDIELNASTKNLYVESGNKINVFGPATTVTVPDAAVNPVSGVSYFSAEFSGTVNPQGVPTSYHFEYRKPGLPFWKETPSQNAGTGSSAVPASASVSGLTQDSEYEVRLVAVNTEADAASVSPSIESFTTLAVPPPAAAVDPPSAITSSGAHLSGTVNPNGFETTWRFQYSTDQIKWTDLAGHDAGAGSSDIAVANDVVGLDPNTHYFVRLAATNPGGTTLAEQQLTTVAIAPTVETLAAGVATETEVTLGALVNPNHAATAYWFEYGPGDCSANPCASFPAGQDASAGAASGAAVVRQLLEGLSPATEYHFRAVAKNAAGTAFGEDMTFETTDPAKGPPHRGIELVSNPDKASQGISTLSLSISGDGERATWQVNSGVPGSPSGAGSLFLAERTAAGWRSHTLLPSLDQGLLGSAAYGVERVSAGFDGFVALAGTGVISTRAHEVALVHLDDSRHQSVLHTFPAGTSFITSNGDGVRESVDADADLSHVLVGSDERIAAAQVPGTLAVYDFGSGTPVLVSRLPNNSVPTCGVTVGRFWESGGSPSGPSINGGNENPDWIATTDGSRAFFGSRGSGSCKEASQLYVRNLTTSTTTLISGPPVAGALPGESDLVRAGEDGQAAIFVTTSRLVATDADTTNDLYRWEEGAAIQCLTCETDPGDIEFTVAASRDLSHVYFASKSQLLAGEGHSYSENNKFNLYAWHDDQVEYVAPTSGLGDGPSVRAKLTPDGTVILFDGTSETTADQVSSNQLYRYDEASGRVACVSCRAGGNTSGAVNPGGDITEAQLSPDGSSVVFRTTEPLVRSDVNQAPDIYEWRDGRVALVTDGITQFTKDPFTGLRIGGMGAGGRDVLFVAAARLTKEVQDPYTQVYDARIGGGFPPPPTPPARCEGDSCQGPLLAPPALAHSGSSSLVGPGNQASRAKKKTRNHKHRAKRKRGAKEPNHSAKGGRKHG